MKTDTQTTGDADPKATSRPRVRAAAPTSFITAAAVLLFAAIGLNATVVKMRLYFRKLPVSLAQPLKSIPAQMGSWTMFSVDEPLDPDVQEVLGTDQYIFRDYVNVTADGGQCAADLIAVLRDGQDPSKLKDDAARKARSEKILDAGKELMAKPELLAAELDQALGNHTTNAKTTDQRNLALGQVQMFYPDAIVRLAVTYYTGGADTVAHVPERCYVADGFQPDFWPPPPTWTLADGRSLTVRYINFVDQTGENRINRSVGYFFHVNGHYESDPLSVRRSLQNLLQRYGYYAKVELMTLDRGQGDQTRSQKTMTDFLSSALPQIEKTFPDWNKVVAASAR